MGYHMPASCRLIPRHRLSWIPSHFHLAHEYCYFLHDECARLVVEYETAGALTLEIKFRDRSEAEAFQKLGDEDAIIGLRKVGRLAEVRRIILNQITIAMVADSLHHIFEALRCMEKRKTVVAFNLLRKPLTDNLMYLSWMLGNEDAFFAAFEKGEPEALTQKRLGNHRSKIIAEAVSKTAAADIINPEDVRKAIFDRSWESGLQAYFQHAVHLVTVDYPELKTSPENFNFIFASPLDDDYYGVAYEALPLVLFYLSHVIVELFDRIKSMDPASKTAFIVRSEVGFALVRGEEAANEMTGALFAAFEGRLHCPACKASMTCSPHNAARMVLGQTLRCGKCHRVGGFPFSYLFDKDVINAVWGNDS